MSRIVVGSSPIHGRGVFARGRIRSGARIGDFEGPRTTRNGTHVLWVRDEDGKDVGIRGKNELRFLNHARRANAEFRGASLYDLTIEPATEGTFSGEIELTSDQVEMLLDGHLYIQIHSTSAPEGNLRGWLLQ